MLLRNSSNASIDSNDNDGDGSTNDISDDNGISNISKNNDDTDGSANDINDNNGSNKNNDGSGGHPGGHHIAVEQCRNMHLKTLLSQCFQYEQANNCVVRYYFPLRYMAECDKCCKMDHDRIQKSFKPNDHFNTPYNITKCVKWYAGEEVRLCALEYVIEDA